MSWREAFVLSFGPGAFGGITVGDWLRVLRENRFAIDRPYWGRAAAITLGSIPDTALRWWENVLYGRRVRRTKIDPPLFVLGVWRSGTTHLHNLLAQDDRFAYPTFYQTLYPHTFLCTEKINARLLATMLPKTRPQDNVAMGVHYLGTIAGYKKNVFPELPPGLRERIATEWRRCFEEWQYST